MKRAVLLARDAEKSISQKTKVLAPGEMIDRSIMRRSIVAASDMHAGEAIRRDKIVFKRPGTGICPSRYKDILGRVTVRSIKKDEQISLADVRGGKR